MAGLTAFMISSLRIKRVKSELNIFAIGRLNKSLAVTQYSYFANKVILQTLPGMALRRFCTVLLINITFGIIARECRLGNKKVSDRKVVGSAVGLTTVAF